MAQLKRSFPDPRSAYVTCDEAALPDDKDTIRRVVYDSFGIDLAWKSDLMPAADLSGLNPLDLSLLNFEMAKRSPRFVGLTNSTFSNMLCLEKYAASFEPVRHHYVYNYRGDRRVERIDNGFKADALLAIAHPHVAP